MPEDYISICKKKGILSETLYLLPENPLPRTTWYECANYTLHSIARGVFELRYALKSFARPTDDARYIAFFVTKSGIFIACNSMCSKDGPIDFNVIRCKFFCDFKGNMLMTLKPNTREIIILNNYRYTEMLDGKGFPNSFYWEENPQLHDKVKKHQILVESDNYSPLLLNWDEELYYTMRLGLPYIWLRSDNYVDINKVIFCRQPY
jgi:hypothetical protein